MHIAKGARGWVELEGETFFNFTAAAAAFDT